METPGQVVYQRGVKFETKEPPGSLDVRAESADPAEKAEYLAERARFVEHAVVELGRARPPRLRDATLSVRFTVWSSLPRTRSVARGERVLRCAYLCDPLDVWIGASQGQQGLDWGGLTKIYIGPHAPPCDLILHRDNTTDARCAPQRQWQSAYLTSTCCHRFGSRSWPMIIKRAFLVYLGSGGCGATQNLSRMFLTGHRCAGRFHLGTGPY
jgi:hypothetical protein